MTSKSRKSKNLHGAPHFNALRTSLVNTNSEIYSLAEYSFTTVNTTQAVGFWYQKLVIPANRTTNCDLNNSNIKAVAESGD